jgi:2-polyprenyl-3-methyl-5-hydroxy-6-metoxy-1,4-benzoquinol methylase
MKVHYESNSDVTRYIENNITTALEDNEPRVDNYLRIVGRYTPINSRTEILEVGTGIGWFPLLCKLRGLRCTGLEISPQLVEVAKEIGLPHGVRPEIILGNLEEYPLPGEFYDVVIASSVFEHVEHWHTGLANLFRTLKSGGVLFFESTNKFSLTSGEYPAFPLYGWLPNSVRYAIRRSVHGEDIMKLGIDFHQFTHPRLRREFQRLGFSRILDRVDAADEDHVSSPLRRKIVAISKRFYPAKVLALTFAEVTRFICIK